MANFKSEQEYFSRFREKKGAMKLGFGSTYSQSKRYGVLTRDLDLQGKRCALLGCGEGAGVPFLQARGCEDIYGFDIIEEHINEAKNRFPDLKDKFYCIEQTKEMFSLVDNLDWVIASGTWNVKTAKKYEKIEELLEMSRSMSVGLATNFTTNISDDDDAHDFCPFKILRLFSEKFEWWKMEHSYFKNDFSVWGMGPR